MRSRVRVVLNGEAREGEVEPRVLLSDFIRDGLGATGTNVGCEQGVCGACSVLVDGSLVRSCLMFAVQAEGSQIDTVEGLAPGPEQLHPLQQAFIDTHALQCGFCTPGFLMTSLSLLRDNPQPAAEDARTYLGGNICRCTGYQNIVEAVMLAARRFGATESA